MRPRGEIEVESQRQHYEPNGQVVDAILEVLLDIRDLLVESNKIEITGKPTGATFPWCYKCKTNGHSNPSPQGDE